MDFAWFLYTIAIMAVALAAAVSSVTVWVLTNRKDCLVAAFAFGVYVLETAGVLFDEYMRSKPIMQELFTTGLTHPFVNITLGVAMVTSIWVWVALYVYVRVSRRQVLLFAGAYALVAVLLAPVGERASVPRTMAFWSVRDFLIIGALVMAWWRRTYRAREAERMSIDRAKGLWRWALILSCLVWVEDVLCIMVIQPDLNNEWLQSFYWHLTERNITDNILMVLCAVRMILYNRSLMGIFAHHPMEVVETGEQQAGSTRDDFDARLLRFSDDRGMSKREREVLRLALEGKRVPGIAQELFISEGTVKAHLHRIYTKAGVDNRQALVESFWKY